MWKCLSLGLVWTTTAFAQGAASAVDFANLREDVRGLVQRVGDLSLRVEQLERENAELRNRLANADRAYATVAQMDKSIEEASRTLRTAIATSKTETLNQVATSIEKLGQQTNAAIDSLAKAQSPLKPAPAPVATFTENYPKEGISYVVEKGDSLASIARKTGGKQQDIINANKLPDASKINVGQTLFIPISK